MTNWKQFNDRYHYSLIEDTGAIVIRDMKYHRDIVLPAQMITQIAKAVKAERLRQSNRV